jgi:hypothetical protein
MVKKEAAKQDESLTGDDFEKYLQWRAKELFILGHKIHLCVLSLDKYYDFPSDAEVEKSLGDNLVFLIKNLFSKGWHDTTGKRIEFSLITEPHKPLPLNVIAEEKSDIPSEWDISVHEHCECIMEKLKLIEVDTEQSLEDIGRQCALIGIRVAFIEKQLSKEDYRIFANVENELRDKAQQAIGYWTGKLKEKKSRRENAMARTTKKEQSKDKIKTWIAEGMKQATVRLKAQKEFEVTDRTVLNWLKEIKEEKAPVLRKSTSIA